MCEYIKAKTLKFLSLDGLYLALTNEKRNNNYPQFSDHYFAVSIINPLTILRRQK